MKVKLSLENKIIYEKNNVFKLQKTFRNSYFIILFFARIELSPRFRYEATNFRMYDLIKIKVEVFGFDLRPVSSFMTMR